MEPNNPTDSLKACPFCAEKIQAAAVKCRFCQSMLPGSVPEQPTPGIFRLLVANLLCPGLGAWRLGHRWRGAAFFLIVTLAAVFWTGEAMEKANAIAQKAVKSKSTLTLRKDLATLRESQWYDVMVWSYGLSFADLIWIFFTLPPVGAKKKLAGVPGAANEEKTRSLDGFPPDQ